MYSRLRIYRYNILRTTYVLLISVMLWAGFVPFTNNSVHADEAADTSIIELASRGSDTIILGTVLEKISYWDSQGITIYTTVIVSVNETLKGKTNNNWITVTYPGGEANGTGQWLSNMPAFETGDNAVLFLNRIATEQLPVTDTLFGGLAGVQYAIYGGYQGKFDIIDGKIGTMTLDEFKEMVHLILEGNVVQIGDTAIASSEVLVPFSFSGNSWPHPPAPNIHFRINENTEDCSGEGIAVQKAAATWSAAGASFTFTYDGASVATTYKANGINEIMWGSLSAGTLAVTCIWYNPATSIIFETDMEFNDNYNWSTAATCAPGYYDVESIALHEFGHFLMLNDLYNTADRDKVMCGYGVSGSTKRALHPDDISGIISIYGAAIAPPGIVNGGTENITAQSARLYGEITSTGGENPAVYLYWGTSDGGVISSNWTDFINLGTRNAGGLSADISGLNSGTTYYYRFYAANSAGDHWSPATANFTTLVSLIVDVSGNGTTTPAPGIHDYELGSSVNITAAASNNWAFINWTGTVTDNTSASTGITMDTTKSVTANFIRTHGTLTLSINGSGSIIPIAGGYTYPVNTTFNLIAVPAPGWRFVNWSGDTGTLGNVNSANTTIFINGDYHITANFSRPILTIIINGGGDVSPGAGTHFYDIGSNATLTAISNGNWTFLSWTGAISSNTSSMNITMDTDKTVTANFLRTHGDLTISVTGSGSITPSTGSYKHPAGTEVNIVAIPSPGWQFVRWNGDTDTVENAYSSNTTIKINGDYNITAIFTTIGTSSTGGGEGMGGGGAVVADDKTITGLLTLVNEQGFLFDNVEATSFDARATLNLPFGTTVKNKVGYPLRILTITNVREPNAPQEGTTLIGNVYDFQPDDATFDPPVPLTISYYDKELPEGITEDMLCIALWDEKTKAYAPLEFNIDTIKNKVTAYITHFSRYTLLAIPKPATFTVSDLVITPNSVNPGDEVKVSVKIANTGHLSGEYTCHLIVNGEQIKQQTTTLEGGKETILEFTLIALERGTNEINIGGLADTFEVSLTPPAFTIVSLRVSESDVKLGQTVEIKAIAANSGQATGIYQLELYINDEIMETRKVFIAGETKREIRFYYTAIATGRIITRVNGWLYSFIVKEPQPSELSPEPAATFPAANEIPAASSNSSKSNNWKVITGISSGGVLTAAVLYLVRWRRRSDKTRL